MRARALAPGASVYVVPDPQPRATLGADSSARLTFDYRDDDTLVYVRVRQSETIAFDSAIGSLRTLGAHSNATDAVGPDELGSLEVSPLTTALAGTVASAHGGALPGTASDFDAAVRAVTDWHALGKRAAYLAAVVAGSVVVPTDATLPALAADPARADVLASRQRIDAVFEPSTLEPVQASAPGVVWLYRGGTALDHLALKLEIGVDGATLLTKQGVERVLVSNADGAIAVDPLGPASTLFEAGLKAQRGGVACSYDISPWVLQFGVNRMDLRAVRVSEVGHVPTALVAGASGYQISGFSLSGCAPFFDNLTPQPLLAFHVEADAPRVASPLALTAGRWLLASGDTHAIVDVFANGAGLGPAALPFTATTAADGSLEVRYDGGRRLRYWAVARFDDAWRVVFERTDVDGTRSVDEGWIAKLDSGPPIHVELRGARLTGCCEQGDLLPLVFDADGNASYERASGLLDPVRVTVEASGALTLPVVPLTSHGDLRVTPIARLDAARVLALTEFPAYPGVAGAQVLTITPL